MVLPPFSTVIVVLIVWPGRASGVMPSAATSGGGSADAGAAASMVVLTTQSTISAANRVSLAAGTIVPSGSVCGDLARVSTRYDKNEYLSYKRQP